MVMGEEGKTINAIPWINTSRGANSVDYWSSSNRRVDGRNPWP